LQEKEESVNDSAPPLRLTLVCCRPDGKLGDMFFNFTVLLTKGHTCHTNASECSFGFHLVTDVLHVAVTVPLQTGIPEGKGALAL